MISEMIETAEKFIADCDAAMIRNTLVSHGFVVWNSVFDSAMGFEFETLDNEKRRAISAHFMPVFRAPRFTRQDAETLASDTYCGADKTPARAMFLNDALELAISKQRELIAKIKGL